MKRNNENRFEGIMAVAAAVIFASLMLMGLTDRVSHPILFYTWIWLTALSFATIGRVAYLSENKKR